MTRTSEVPKARARVYLSRGRRLLMMVDAAESTKNWDGVAVNAVQAAISLSDAYTVAKLGLRSRGQDHHEAVTLVSNVSSPSSSRIAGFLQAVVDLKSEVEYGETEVSASTARRIASTVRKLGSLVEADLS
jgi:hypothetical protein